MKRLFCILAAALLSFVADAQELTLNVVPRYTYGLTMPANVEVTQGTGFSTTEFRTKYSGILIDTDGTQKNVTQTTDGLGLDVMLKYTNPQTNDAWGVLAGLYRQKFLNYTSHPIFNFKGNELGGSVNFYRATGLTLGLRRVFAKNQKSMWYAQMNAFYSFSAQKKGSKVLEWNKYVAGGQTTYIEAGTGTISKVLSVNQSSLVVGPEVGFTGKGPFAIELSLSYQHPVGNPLATETDSYYKSGRLSGTEQTTLTQQSIFINLRVPFQVFKFSNQPKVRQPRQPRVKEKPQPTPPPVPTKKPDDDLSNYKKNEPVKLKNVIFAQGEDKLLPSSYPELDKLVKLMKNRPTLEIRLEGHTDKIGGSEENMKLSNDRVTAVKNYLASKGIDSNRVSTIGYGDTRTICPPPCQDNRRVEFVVTKE